MQSKFGFASILPIGTETKRHSFNDVRHAIYRIFFGANSFVHIKLPHALGVIYGSIGMRTISIIPVYNILF